MRVCAMMGTVLLLVGTAWGGTFHVSVEGNDANSGLGPSAGEALRTIQAGVDRLQPGDTLLIRGGRYRETVTFPRGGTAEAPITLEPYPAETVIVTGCEPVVNWTVYDADKGIWTAPMDWDLGKGRNQVFVDGEILIEARHPNEPDPGLEMYVSDLSPLWPTFAELSIPNPVEEPGRITGKLFEGFPDDYWKGARYYGIHYEGWSAQTGIVQASKDGEITVGDRTRTWWFGPAYGGGYKPEEGRGMITGHMNALNRPGEWHWQDRMLFLIPKRGDKPTNVEAKARQLAFDLSGRQHIHISGINIAAASMRMQDSAFCTIDDCHIEYVSHYTRHYDIGQIEDGRDTIKSGETGIFVGGHDNAFLNCGVRFSAGAGFYLRGYHHTIHNCLIDEVSYTSHYLNAITDAVSDFNDYENFLVGGHAITCNTMRNAGRHFFNIYGNGTSQASRTRGPMDYMATLFAHNHLYNGMLQTKDAGFITGYYCSGGTLDGLNTQIAYNVIHDCFDIFAMRINVLGLVYLDAGTCDVDLHHNLLWAAPGSLQRGLWFNTMCVDIHEHDNPFHANFERTCAELVPADFPEGKPFRFGHDFENPPPMAVWPQLERRVIAAKDCPGHSEGITQSASGMTGLTDGAWIGLGDVDFDQGWQSAIMEFASPVKTLNTDCSARARPRHQKATDPLVLEAIQNDGMEQGIHKQWTFAYNTLPDSWIRFNQVHLGNGYRRFRAIYGQDQEAPRRLEVRLDSLDGPLAVLLDLPQTDKPRGPRVQIYAETTGAVAPEATGTHDIFIVFRSDDGKPAGEFEYFRFEQYRGLIDLQPSEVKLELRADSPEGEKIGGFYPRFTGEHPVFREMVAPLEPASGTRPLYAVVRSAVEGLIGTVRAFRLEKAHTPIDWTGVGEPPLMRGNALVFPEPTHRPCARPADKYPVRRTATASHPCPVIGATRLELLPAVDGRIEEWTVLGELITLGESWDGSETNVSTSRAWAGYDDDALFLAAHHPVSKVSALNTTGHVWGATDAMEIVLQRAFGEKPYPILNFRGWPDGHMQVSGIAGTPADLVEQLTSAVTYRADIAADGWTCEWRLPFSACGFTPASAPLLRFNLGVRKTEGDGWAIWRGTGGATYIAERGGLLGFPRELAAAQPLPQEGLALWLDAADPAALGMDESGLIAVWKDKSGRGHDARQDSPAHRPLHETAGLNGQPALRFDEKRRTRMELPDLSQEKTDATVFAVFANPEPGSEVNHDPRILTGSDGQGFDYLVGIAATVPGMETGGPRQTVQVFTNRWAKFLRVGCFSPNVQTFFSGTIAEIIVYTRTLTPSEQDRVQGYLALKWRL